MTREARLAAAEAAVAPPAYTDGSHERYEQMRSRRMGAYASPRGADPRSDADPRQPAVFDAFSVE